MREPLGRIGRIERHVGAAGLHHGQDRHHDGGAALHAEGDAIVGRDAQPAQPVREPVGAGIEFGIAQPFPRIDHRDRIGTARRLLLDQLVQAGVLGERHRRIVPVHQQLLALGAGQQIGAAVIGLRVGGDGLQRGHVISEDARALGRRETRRVELEIDAQAARHVAEAHAEREVGGLETMAAARLEAGVPRQRFVDVEIDVVEGHLVQRGAIVVELDLEVRVMAMTDHLQLGAEGLADQLGPARWLQFLAQRQGVQEQAQHLLAVVLLLAHVRHQAGGHVQFARQHRQHPQVRGQQHAAHRHAQSVRHRAQPVAHAFVDARAERRRRRAGFGGFGGRQFAEGIAG
nr:hypothetical protein [Burkholderia gladioli]